MFIDMIVEMVLFIELVVIREGVVIVFLFFCIMRIGNVCGEDCRGCFFMFIRNFGIYYLFYNLLCVLFVI